MEVREAIAEYAGRTGKGDDNAAPYDRESLTVIYGARVRQLVELEREGFTHAEWRWDTGAGCNRWHGV